MRESIVERIICDECMKRKGVCWKWISPGRRGVPDRICIFPGGRIVFVEVKRPDVKDGRSASQKKVFSILEGLGCTVRVCNSPQAFYDILEELGL